MCKRSFFLLAVILYASPLVADVVHEFEFTDELGWYFRSDVGMLLVYGDGQLQATDLLGDNLAPLPPIRVPDLSARNSVVPIARTGLLLVPGTAGDDGMKHSYAIDTLGNRVLWKNEPLPAPDIIFSYPGPGIAVMRSFDGDGHLLGVELSTGRTLWDIARNVTILWTHGDYIRFVADGVLMTVDVMSGEIVRSDPLNVPRETRLYALDKEQVILFWRNKYITAYSLPPAPPAEAAAPRRLWDFEAAGKMMNLCINGGGCDVDRIGDDVLLVSSPGHQELVRISDGELLFDVEPGMFPAAIQISPNNRLVAVAKRKQLEVRAIESGRLIHAVAYPKGDEGKKSMKSIRWLDDDTLMLVYPDKKGNPRKMSGFSAAQGKLLWTFVLPDVADYALTGEQRARLLSRIALSLVATAVSASNAWSVGGTSYYAVFVPNLDVGETLDATAGMGRGSVAGGTGSESAFAKGVRRHAQTLERSAIRSRLQHFVVGNRGKYDVLAIDLRNGNVDKAVNIDTDKVHDITPLTPFGVGLAVEDNYHKLRLFEVAIH